MLNSGSLWFQSPAWKVITKNILKSPGFIKEGPYHRDNAALSSTYMMQLGEKKSKVKSQSSDWKSQYDTCNTSLCPLLCPGNPSGDKHHPCFAFGIYEVADMQLGTEPKSDLETQTTTWIKRKKKSEKKTDFEKDILKEAKAIWFPQNDRQHAIGNYRVRKSY